MKMVYDGGMKSNSNKFVAAVTLAAASFAMPVGARDKPSAADLAACAAAEQRQELVGPCWRALARVEDTFRRLWTKKPPQEPFRKGTTETLAPYTALELEDRDRDGRGDFFAYYPGGGSRRTQEFGAYFDLSGDGRPDWIVYYGGILPTKGFASFFIWNHLAIDTNGDGHFDVRVWEGIDMDGDGFSEEHASAWLFDTDHDGLADRAEHIVSGKVSEITPENGAFPLRYVLLPEPAKQPRIGEAMPTARFDQIAKDISILLAN